MKRIYVILFNLFLVLSLFAQSQKGYVYLKNGSILKGKYQYTEDLTKLKIESAGNIWIFNADEIDHVSDNKTHIEEAGGVQENKAFSFRTEAGVLAGNSGNSQSAPFSFSSAANYSVLPKLSVGAGIGLEFLKETYLPAFVNIEYKFRKSWSSPYVFLKTGYEIAIEESNEIYNNVQPVYYDYMVWPYPDYQNQKLDTKGGFMINPGLGYQKMFSSGFGMSFAFGYQFHRLSYTGENDYQLDIDYNRLTIKLGIIFN